VTGYAGTVAPPPQDFLGDTPVPVREAPAAALENGNPEIAAQRLANLLTQGRTEHVDGRYYEKVGDLALDASAFRPVGGAALPTDANAVFPLSNEGDSERRFDEVAARFGRLANLVSVRSDVFEIIVTAQAGYGVDEDGDGRINYRGSEFQVTAENKTRVVYERRSPIDQSARARD